MYKDLFNKQPMMRKVVYALMPIYIFSIWMYGINVFFLTLVVFSFGFLTEYLMEKSRKKKVSEALYVTCMLFTLSLPPKTPWWVAAIGIIFAVLIGKEVYGGFGRNIFNPAISGRLLIYIAFPNIMTTSSWMNYGNFGSHINDAVTSATPLAALRQNGNLDLINLFFGMRNGSIGESSVFLILIGAIFLLITKTANWRIMLSTIGSAGILAFLLDVMKVPGALPVLPSLMSGSLLFITVFMATDPVSAPKKVKSLWFYGIIIGCTTIIVRTFSLFPEGASFGVMIGNVFASLLDEIFSEKKVAS